MRKKIIKHSEEILIAVSVAVPLLLVGWPLLLPIFGYLLITVIGFSFLFFMGMAANGIETVMEGMRNWENARKIMIHWNNAKKIIGNIFTVIFGPFALLIVGFQSLCAIVMIVAVLAGAIMFLFGLVPQTRYEL